MFAIMMGPNLLHDSLITVEKEIADLTEGALSQSQGQGYVRNPADRREIENHAVQMAEKYFVGLGYSVKNVSKSQPYDLLCFQGKDELHVEVKGTTTDGRAVILTPNEVKHARSRTEAKKTLYVLHSIQLKRGKAGNGQQIVISRWQLQEAALRPTGYIYTVPRITITK